MYKQPPINTWGIFHARRSTRQFQCFKRLFQEFMKEFNLDFKKPKVFEVGGRDDDPDTWVRELQNTLKEKKGCIDMVVLIIPGKNKTDARLYNPIK